MIKVETNNSEVNVTMNGSLPMLCADTTQILRAIHHAIQGCDGEQAAEFYKVAMEKNLCKLAFKKDGETPEIDGILDALKELIELIKK